MNTHDLIKCGLPAFRVVTEDGAPAYCTEAEAAIWRERGYEPEPLCLVTECELARMRERASSATLYAVAAPAIPDEIPVVGMLQIVEGFPPQDWRNERGERLKDTSAWVQFYNWAKGRMQSAKVTP